VPPDIPRLPGNNHGVLADHSRQVSVHPGRGQRIPPSGTAPGPRPDPRSPSWLCFLLSMAGRRSDARGQTIEGFRTHRRSRVIPALELMKCGKALPPPPGRTIGIILLTNPPEAYSASAQFTSRGTSWRGLPSVGKSAPQSSPLPPLPDRARLPRAGDSDSRAARSTAAGCLVALGGAT
jgi:hypothetical protein